jgi:hypothetical protein
MEYDSQGEMGKIEEEGEKGATLVGSSSLNTQNDCNTKCLTHLMA